MKIKSEGTYYYLVLQDNENRHVSFKAPEGFSEGMDASDGVAIFIDFFEKLELLEIPDVRALLNEYHVEVQS